MTDTIRIDAILAGLPADQRAALQHLRETIAEVPPKLVRARMVESDERWGSWS